VSGFVAQLNLDGVPVEGRPFERMAAWLACRGPDGQGRHVSRNAGLASALLKVTDESAHEEQPLTIDGRCWTVADARIDARDELIAELNAELNPPAPDTISNAATDVELISRAYQAWGEDCVSHLLGDFTFAVWDELRGRLFCARDHLGVKPCFYAQCGRTIVVSNTLDCVRLHPSVSGVLDESSVADFLLFGANQDVEATAFRDIRRLPPAHAITWSGHRARPHRYWTLPVEGPVAFRNSHDYVDRFRDLLRLATRDRLRSRGRVGVLMSGGLDSPALAATATGILREQRSGVAIHAVTSVYDRLVPDPERHYARLVAAHLNIPIRYDVRDDEISIADWHRVSVRTPEPVANPAAFVASVAFLRTLEPDTRVLLYGEGPDNALRYEWRPYVSHLLATRRLASLLRAFVDDAWWHPRVPLLSSLRQFATAGRQRTRWQEAFPVWLNESFAARQHCRDRWEARHRRQESPHTLRPFAYASFSDPGWQMLFDDCDVTGAAGHVEFRHPFLDLRLLRYLLALPAIPWCRNKLVIRRAMQSVLPRAVLRRKKASLAASPDLERVLASGFPRLAPSSGLGQYVDPGKIQSAPHTEVELRAALRPLGLNYWLQHLAAVNEENWHGTASASSRA
jgi:asparagine synthase (glutamine-hydrolysing)